MTKVLKLDEIKRLIDSRRLIREIETGFVLYSEGRVVVPPVGARPQLHSSTRRVRSAFTSASQNFKKTAPKNVRGEAEVELEPGPQMDPEMPKSLIKPVENDDLCSKKDYDKH